MSTAAIHHSIDWAAKLIEMAGAAIIVVSVIFATVWFIRDGPGRGGWREGYDRYRSNLGRGILLGLELLVGADIISTITAPLTLESVGLLAGVVAIRTFLSFSLETEIEGCWPWERSARQRAGEEK